MEIDLTPTAVEGKAPKQRLRELVEALGQLARVGDGPPEESAAEFVRRSFVERLIQVPAADRLRMVAAGNLLTDLAKSGWHLRWERGAVLGTRPTSDTGEVRATRRAQLSNRRSEQLREAPTRSFITMMESGHAYRGQVVSIFQLMRDGRDLARALQEARSSADVGAQLSKCVKPYLQFAGLGAVCEHTGFSLQDIWRYFRHTWSSAYESIPGRSMQLLVRDAAVTYHPVIGIASIASAASIQPARDREIGWTREQVLEEARGRPTARIAEWVLETLSDSLADIYKQDFIEEKVLPLRLPKQVPQEVIDHLKSIGEAAQRRHIKQAERIEHKGGDSDATDEEGLARIARSDLYRGKRAAELATLLEIRNVVQGAYEGKRGKERLAHLLTTGAGRSAFEKLIRRARSTSVGTVIADLNVCGAIAPYGELLGGKLIAMLAVSPQVVSEYRRRYRGKASWIASRMAGRPVVRDAELVFVGTTSLYGTRPSQYDRASYPAKIVGGLDDQAIRYRFLANTEGIGTAQFTVSTKEAVSRLLLQGANQGERVKNIFGEGANPKLRLMREGIAALGIRGAMNARNGDDSLLIHGMSKAAYGVWLVKNLRDYLLGFSKRPQYLFRLEDAAKGTERICEWWLQRWVRNRLDRPGIFERIAEHSLVRPVRHGARVALPEIDVAQGSLL